MPTTPILSLLLLNMHQILPLSLLLILSIISPSHQQQHCSTPVRAGYWLPHSSHYSPPSSINTSLYTHLYYSLPISEADSLLSLPLLTAFSDALKPSNSSLKTLVSITASNPHTATFSSMAADPALRAAFIDTTIQLAREAAFDGLDLAWQFPSSSPDMENFATLLEEWRARINQEAQSLPLLLTATVYFSNHVFDNDVYYPIDAITANLDWINALCFGYRNSDGVTGADAALYNKASHFSTSYGITSWLDAGVPSCKLVVGFPLYGRTWFLKNKAKNGLAAPVVAAGARQRLSNQTGIMAYFEIRQLSENSGLVATYDNDTVSAYFNTGGLWVSFDSQEVVEEKIEFALSNRLLGYFLWPISFDDLNYTASKQAMDIWLRDQASGAEDGIGTQEALSPDKLPPRDNAPISSAALGGLRRGISATNKFYLNSVLLMFLLL